MLYSRLLKYNTKLYSDIISHMKLSEYYFHCSRTFLADELNIINEWNFQWKYVQFNIVKKKRIRKRKDL